MIGILIAILVAALVYALCVALGFHRSSASSRRSSSSWVAFRAEASGSGAAGAADAERPTERVAAAAHDLLERLRGGARTPRRATCSRSAAQGPTGSMLYRVDEAASTLGSLRVAPAATVG